MRSIALGFAGGAWYLQRLAFLPETAQMGWLAAACAVLLIARKAIASLSYFHSPSVKRRAHRRRALAVSRCLLLGLAAALAGFDWAAWRAHQYALAVWPAAWEGRDVVLTGRVETMPIRAATVEMSPGRGFQRAKGSRDWLLTLHVLAVAPTEKRRVDSAEKGRDGVLAVDAATATAVPLNGIGRGRDGDGDRFAGRVQLRLRGTDATSPPQAGEVWRMVARLQRPHGLANFGLPMREASLFQRGIRATGSARSPRRIAPVRASAHDVASPQLWANHSEPGGSWSRLKADAESGENVRLFAADEWRVWRLRAAIERLRSRIDNRIDVVLSGQPHRGVVAALALGVQSAISPEDWARFTRTGTNHLVAVSGLHIGLAAAVAAWCANGLLRWFGARTWGRRRSKGVATFGWRAPPLLLIVPRQRLVGVVAIAAAGSFVALSGFGIPAQRAFWMLTAYCLTSLDGRRVGVTVIWCLALWLVVLADPWAVQSAGGWLSFAAIGAILYIGSIVPRPIRPPRRSGDGAVEAGTGAHTSGSRAARFTMPVRPGEWHPLAEGMPASAFRAETVTKARDRPGKVATKARWLMRRIGLVCKVQLALSLALAPASLAWFGETSLVGPLANGLAIPWVSVVAVPAVFLGLLLPAPLDVWAWRVAHGALTGLHWGLGYLSDSAAIVLARFGASDMIRVPIPGTSILWCACVGVALYLAPRSTYLFGVSHGARQALAAALCLPILFYRPSAPAAGDFRVTMFDIGQGNGVLVETRSHRLLYDSGPPLGPADDAGRRVIVPALRRHGIDTLDALIISHPHDDHYGGAFAVIDNLTVRHLLASWPAQNDVPPPGVHDAKRAATLPPLWRHAGARGVMRRRCRAGEMWQWEGVRFETLWPIDPTVRAPPNHTSCVLRISNGRHTVLLTGDIEAPQEARLLQAGANLSADVMLVPHHGSATSSTEAFLDAVAPRHAVFQVGFRNRHRHPAARVVPRYRARGIARYRSDVDGAVRFSSLGPALRVEALRRDRRRYWMTPLPEW